MGLGVVVQAVEALNAGDDLVGSAGAGLVGEFRVSNEASGHGDNVGFAVSYDTVHLSGIVHAAKGEDGNVDIGVSLNGLSKISVGSIVNESGGVDDVHVHQVVAALRDMDHVYLVLDKLDYLDDFINVKAVFGTLIARYTQVQQELFAHSGTDSIQDHHQEAGTVFGGTAILVSAVVGLGGEELSQAKTVTGVDEDHIEAAGEGILAIIGIAFCNALHLFDRHLLYMDTVGCFQVRGAIEGPAIILVELLIAAILEISGFQSSLGAEGVDCIGLLGEVTPLEIVVQVILVPKPFLRTVDIDLRVNMAGAAVDKGCAATGFIGVITDRSLGRSVFFGLETLVRGSDKYTVAEGYSADGYRTKKMGICLLH